MKRLAIFTLLLLIGTSQLFAQRIVKDLNRGWQFAEGWQVNRNIQNQQEINVPHTWNLDALSGKTDYYRGQGNYLRQLEIPLEWQNDKQIYVKFNGVNHSADVFVNGKHVGSHKGGYTAFGFDITPFVNPGMVNTLWVRASNAQDLNVMPLTGNFNVYGGIHRGVEMIVTPTTHISHTEFATSGVKVTTMSVNAQKATVNISALVEGVVGSNIDVRFVIRDEEGTKIDSLQKNVRIGMEGSGAPSWAATIPSPRLWNGTIDPHQYSVDVMVLTENGRKELILKDSIRQKFGLRTFSVNENNEFILNGAKYPIHGVTRIGDNALFGTAIYDQESEADIALLKEMGANAVRLANYPTNEKFLELCDREGIIVWSEIPFVGPGEFRNTGFNNTDEFKDNGELQLQEMIAQQYNHPSVMMWGLFNEISQRGDDPINYIRLLNSIAKDEDPSRLTVGASNQDGEINFVTDLIGFNINLGWKEGMPEDVKGWAERLRRQWPRLKVGLSEYGAGGSIYQHELNGTRPTINSYWHPEEWQTYLHEEYLKAISDGNFFWGTFAGSLADWGVAHYSNGTRNGISDFGLVTFDRNTKKDAFYLYKANWNKEEPFAHIASRRYKDRKELTENIKVYSNCDSLTLNLNGAEIGTVGSNGFGTFVFENCEMAIGENVIRVVGEGNVEDEITVNVVNE